MAENSKIKQFRSDLARLKRQGLLPRGVDPRTAEIHTTKPYSKRLQAALRKLKPILKGEAKAVKLPPAELAAARKSGYFTQNGKVILPVPKQSKVSVSHGKVTITGPGGFKYKPQFNKSLDLEALLVEKSEPIQKFLDESPSHHIAFKVYGNNSYKIYRDRQLAIDDLVAYKSFDKTPITELYQHLTFIEVPSVSDYEFPDERRQFFRSQARKKRTPGQRIKERQRMLPYQKSDEKEKNRKREATRRANMSAVEKAEYNRKARERAKK